ncbi:MAG: hypothetical protein ACYTEQ_19685 [Planctomycetota bacterium]|jgi:hypothetical protein
MKTTKAERDEWRAEHTGDTGCMVNPCIELDEFVRLLDDADELARLREGLFALELCGPCRDHVRVSDVAALLEGE